MLYVSDVKGSKIGVFDTYSETFRGYFEPEILTKALQKSNRVLYGYKNGVPAVVDRNTLCRTEGIKIKMVTKGTLQIVKQKNGYALSCDFYKLLLNNDYFNHLTSGWDMVKAPAIITKLTETFKNYKHSYLRISADLNEIKYMNNLFGSAEYDYTAPKEDNLLSVRTEEDLPIYSGLKQIVITGDTSRVLYWDSAFASLKKLENVTFEERFNLNNALSLKRMFYNCNKLESVIFPKCNAENLRVTSNMFAGCKNIKRIDLSKMIVSDKLVYIEGMFSDCLNLEELHLPKGMGYRESKGHNFYRSFLWSAYNLKRLIVDKEHLESWKEFIVKYKDDIFANLPDNFNPPDIQVIGE